MEVKVRRWRLPGLDWSPQVPVWTAAGHRFRKEKIFSAADTSANTTFLWLIFSTVMWVSPPFICCAKSGSILIRTQPHFFFRYYSNWAIVDGIEVTISSHTGVSSIPSPDLELSVWCTCDWGTETDSQREKIIINGQNNRVNNRVGRKFLFKTSSSNKKKIQMLWRLECYSSEGLSIQMPQKSIEIWECYNLTNVVFANAEIVRC